MSTCSLNDTTTFQGSQLVRTSMARMKRLASVKKMSLQIQSIEWRS
jgi:hypothetical protein